MIKKVLRLQFVSYNHLPLLLAAESSTADTGTRASCVFLVFTVLCGPGRNLLFQTRPSSLCLCRCPELLPVLQPSPTVCRFCL